MQRRLLIVFATLVMPLLGKPPAACAQQTAGGTVELLWPVGAPGAHGNEDSDRPSLTVYLPAAERATGTGVVIFPGGGYGHLAVDHEGRQVAEWLNSLGVAAFVVRYRLGPKYRHPTMLTDAQRAVRIVRARAKDWQVNPTRIGILGFSAGGHLASTAGTHFDAGVAGSADPVQAVSSRPDFMVLIYPVITMSDEYTHAGSKRNLLGPKPDPNLAALLSNEKHITASTPPIFLVHTTDDAAVPVENSLLFYAAARRAGVPVEMHIFETGRHGFGLARSNPVLSRWPGLAEAWLQSHGWLGSVATQK